MARPKLNLSESDVSQDINIEKLLGRAARDEVVRETFFQLAFDQLQQRLDQGRDVNGKLMSKYSKAYKDSLAFAAFSKKDTVNMQLTGDMISSIAIKGSNAKKMTIGFDGEFNNLKAFAQIEGPKPREFFGWTDEALQKISNKMKPDLGDQGPVSDNKVISLIGKIFGKLLADG